MAVRVLTVAVACGLLSGCVTTWITPAVMVNVPSANNAKWTVTATVQPPARFTFPEVDQVSLYINGTLIGTSNVLPSANIKGMYQGHAIQALCPSAKSTPLKQCQVYVDGTMLATLYFNPK